MQTQPRRFIVVRSIGPLQDETLSLPVAKIASIKEGQNYTYVLMDDNTQYRVRETLTQLTSTLNSDLR